MRVDPIDGARPASDAPHVPRVMGLGDLVFFYVITGFSLQC